MKHLTIAAIIFATIAACSPADARPWHSFKQGRSDINIGVGSMDWAFETHKGEAK